MTPRPGPPPPWVAELDRVLTSVSRTLRSPALHERVTRRAGVEVGEHLQLTLAHIGGTEPVRVTDLAESLDLERSTTSRRVTLLVDAGLVERTVDPDDRRAASLRLTPAGHAVVEQVQQSWLVILGELALPWSERRRTETLRRLRELEHDLNSLDTKGSPGS